MSKTAWSHLPNAAHIDRVLVSVKAHIEEWDTAWDTALKAAWDTTWDTAWDTTWNATGEAVRDKEWGAVREAARPAVWGAAGETVRVKAWNAAQVAITALIAWDDSAQYLAMTADELRVFYALSERPECLLLLPAVVAFEKIAARELVAA